MTTRTSCPRRRRTLGSAPVTSAKPPTLAKGTTSAAAMRIFNVSNYVKPCLGSDCNLGRLTDERTVQPVQLASNAGPAIAASGLNSRSAKLAAQRGRIEDLADAARKLLRAAAGDEKTGHTIYNGRA